MNKTQGEQYLDSGLLSKAHPDRKAAAREPNSLRVKAQNFFELGMRNTAHPAVDSGDNSDVRMMERMTQGVSTDHSSGAHDDETHLALRESIHDSGRSSTQST